MLNACSRLSRSPSAPLQVQEVDEPGCIMGFFTLQFNGFNLNERHLQEIQGLGRGPRILYSRLPPFTSSHSSVRHLSPRHSPSGFWGPLSPATQPRAGNAPRGTSPGIPHSPLKFPQLLPPWVNSPFLKSCSNSPSWVWSLFPSKSKLPGWAQDTSPLQKMASAPSCPPSKSSNHFQRALPSPRCSL